VECDRLVQQALAPGSRWDGEHDPDTRIGMDIQAGLPADVEHGGRMDLYPLMFDPKDRTNRALQANGDLDMFVTPDQGADQGGSLVRERGRSPRRPHGGRRVRDRGAGPRRRCAGRRQIRVVPEGARVTEIP
jgi:hypothetical protein